MHFYLKVKCLHPAVNLFLTIILTLEYIHWTASITEPSSVFMAWMMSDDNKHRFNQKTPVDALTQP